MQSKGSQDLTSLEAGSWVSNENRVEAECTSRTPSQSNTGNCRRTGTTAILSRVATRRLEEILPHPSYVRHGLSVSPSQLSALASLEDLAFREPIVITLNRTIIDGYARFQLAQQLRRESIVCIEHDLSEEEALRWLIRSRRPSRGLNAFNRVLLALDLEPILQEAARANQQWGGQNKGKSN